jgi:uncharacterized protein (TIGR02271 family)
MDWSDVIKKEARGATEDVDLGEVQDLGQTYVHTQRGRGDKTQFFIPKYLVRGYDGSALWFNVSVGQINDFARMTPPSDEDYRRRYRTQQMQPDIERRIPLISERLDVKKRPVREEAVITKEPVRETKTVEVPVKREQLTIERKPASGTAQATREGPVQSRTDVRVPLEREEVDVSKTPEVREEVVARKTPMTETRRVTEEVKDEAVRTTGGKNVTTTTKSTEEEE